MHKVIHVCAKELVASKKDRYCIELYFTKSLETFWLRTTKAPLYSDLKILFDSLGPYVLFRIIHNWVQLT